MFIPSAMVGVVGCSGVWVSGVFMTGTLTSDRLGDELEAISEGEIRECELAEFTTSSSLGCCWLVMLVVLAVVAEGCCWSMME